MKKILIFSISLLLSFSSFALSNTLTIKKNRVIKTQGDVFYKWPHKWKFSYLMKHWKPYAIQETTDIVRYAKKKCSKLKLEELGYDCKKLESQKIEVDTLFN